MRTMKHHFTLFKNWLLDPFRIGVDLNPILAKLDSFLDSKDPSMQPSSMFLNPPAGMITAGTITAGTITAGTITGRLITSSRWLSLGRRHAALENTHPKLALSLYRSAFALCVEEAHRVYDEERTDAILTGNTLDWANDDLAWAMLNAREDLYNFQQEMVGRS